MKLSPLFTDNAVLAENKPIRVFGTGCGDITVSLDGECVKAVCRGGKWIAELPAKKAGGPYELTVCADGEKTVVKNVYTGRVYLLAGQSNAEFQLCQSNTDPALYEDDGLLRNYHVVRPWCVPDVFPADAGWRAAEKDGVGSWSALGYLTGRKIRKTEGGAVGVVSCFQGASVIESWLPSDKAAEARLPDPLVYIDHTYPDFAAWNGNSVIYEKMLSPLFPFSFTGVIWYQGESDTTVREAEIYDRSLLSFMECVRKGTNDPSLFFAVIQIADYDHRKTSDPLGWKGIQEAQKRAADRDAHSALVVSADICESSEIHPPTKALLASRTAQTLISNE